MQAANLQPVQMTELEAEFSKLGSQKAVPTRYIRSQQVKQAKMAEVVNDEGEYQQCLQIYLFVHSARALDYFIRNQGSICLHQRQKNQYCSATKLEKQNTL